MYLLKIFTDSLYTLKNKVSDYWSRDKEIINKDLPLSLSVDDAKCLDYDMENITFTSAYYKKSIPIIGSNKKIRENKEVNDTLNMV